MTIEEIRRRIARRTRCMECGERLAGRDAALGYVVCEGCREERFWRESLAATEARRAADWNG